MYNIHIAAALAKAHRDHLLRQAEEHRRLQAARARSHQDPHHFPLAGILRRVPHTRRPAVKEPVRTTATPRQIVEAIEKTSASPKSKRETFKGYGVMGLPFESGHILGLRRFPVSSIGPGYTSIWHRTPEGKWSFWSTTSAEVSCARYAGEISEDTHQTAIDLAWSEPYRLTIASENPSLRWEVTVAATPTSRALGTLVRAAPDNLLGYDNLLKILGPIAGTALAGRLTLAGKMPNRQSFRLIPSHVWPVTASCAQLRGTDLGKPAALHEQATIGDFRIPQHGLLAVGNLDFEVLNPALHSTRTARPSHHL